MALTAMAIATRHKRTPLARFIAREASFVSAFPEIALMNCWRYLKCTDAKMVPGMARFFTFLTAGAGPGFRRQIRHRICLRSQRAAIGPPTTKADCEAKN
ncbi:MAG: hypothetical protein EOS10_28090 [Mesorhizobium sp.]|uniref:hypothetical protein n=1 Tax=Mesorhizobium sp. TaxID=1871066 RepID=UPI000FE6973E|nr:hypothetical protein [Mesorhizobium sp.]RWO26862.1 MAG: hypothetical protein EOS10_28090 [Mesorhizobium sp.]TIN77623.1 MAG: hypothetical protein E5Y09_15700 [Mesorhizobium sp.]